MIFLKKHRTFFLIVFGILCAVMGMIGYSFGKSRGTTGILVRKTGLPEQMGEKDETLLPEAAAANKTGLTDEKVYTDEKATADETGITDGEAVTDEEVIASEEVIRDTTGNADEQKTADTNVTVEKAAIDKKGARDAYIIADSDSRYLTDEELSSYTEEQRMLAKNEIYARHGRQFVTEYVSSYFESKPWYQGNISPEEFDREQNRILNPYELANVEKLTDWQH